MFRKALAALVCLVLLCVTAFAAPSIPEAAECFYVLDAANVLSEQTEARIVHSNDLLYKACGAQIVIVTVDATDGHDIDDYAFELFNDWEIGDANKNNGFLLLMAIGDDDYYATSGIGLEKDFTYDKLKEMLNEYLEPDFAKRQYDDGAVKFFDAVFAEMADIYGANVAVEDGMKQHSESEQDYTHVISLCVGIMLVFGIISCVWMVI